MTLSTYDKNYLNLTLPLNDLIIISFFINELIKLLKKNIIKD